MNIENMPDDCLLYILNHFYRFDTLLNCSEVCKRWKSLVRKRIRKVEYLTDDGIMVRYPIGNTIIYNDELERTEVSKWFPNLKILFVSYDNLDVDFITTLTFKGLVLTSYCKGLDNVTFHNPSLEMLVISHICSFFANEIQGPIMKQLNIGACNVSDFARCAKYFPNLKRLHIEEYTDYTSDNFYTGPVLEKIEILEMIFHAQISPGEYHGFSLADHCPALKSAFHYIQNWYPESEFLVDSGIKNQFLEDLVLQFESGLDWSVLRRILRKYTNLKHLAIRGPTEISDENIPELLELLPRIILIDIRSSRKVTEKSTDYIDRYCTHHNRAISLYYNNSRPKITKKWPHLSRKPVRIGRGFDFMKYCFLRNHDDLPLLLDPVE